MSIVDAFTCIEAFSAQIMSGLKRVDSHNCMPVSLKGLCAKIYGLNKQEPHYILDPKEVKGANYPSESFRTISGDEFSRIGEYHTKRLALEAWERISSGV